MYYSFKYNTANHQGTHFMTKEVDQKGHAHRNHYLPIYLIIYKGAAW